MTKPKGYVNDFMNYNFYLHIPTSPYT